MHETAFGLKHTCVSGTTSYDAPKGAGSEVGRRVELDTALALGTPSWHLGLPLGGHCAV